MKLVIVKHPLNILFTSLILNLPKTYVLLLNKTM
jgi:hypothetical protein